MMRRWGRTLVVVLMCAATACRTSDSVTGVDATDWDAWPWMGASVPDGVVLSARVAAADTTGARPVIVTFANTGTDSATVSYGGCSFGVRLYSGSTLAGAPVWDDRPPPTAACVAIEYVVSLAPHEFRDRQVALLRTNPGLHDPPPAGRYYAGAVWRSAAKGGVHVVPAGSVSIP